MYTADSLTDAERLHAALSNSRRLRADARHFCEQARLDLQRGKASLNTLQLLAETVSKCPQVPRRPGAG